MRSISGGGFLKLVRRWEAEFFFGGVFQSKAKHFLRIVIRLRVLDFVKPCFCCRMFRNEELAAILVWNRRNIERSDPAGLIDYLLFVHPDQRAQYRESRRLLNDGH